MSCRFRVFGKFTKGRCWTWIFKATSSPSGCGLISIVAFTAQRAQATLGFRVCCPSSVSGLQALPVVGAGSRIAGMVRKSINIFCLLLR